MNSALDGALEQLTSKPVPGIGVVVVDGQTVRVRAAAGTRAVGTGAPMTPDTVAMWFSMTKIVTATALMRLVEQEALSLDDPIHRFLPEFPEPRAGWPRVRVHHLLSHSAGLANPIPVRWVHPAESPGEDPRSFALRLLRRHRRLRFPAGSRAAYSNLGYVALGEVIRSAAGEPYQDYVRAQILEPLSMRNTGFRYEALGGEVATGYQLRRSPMTPLLQLILPRGILGPPEGRFVALNPFLVEGSAYGGLLGSVADAARFMAMHLNGGEFEGVRILRPGSVAAMQTIRAAGRTLEVGLGWFRRGSPRSRGGPHLEHLGGGAGFWSMMRIHPQRRIGVVAMGNSTKYDHELVAKTALAA